jgi:hypothetical protein
MRENPETVRAAALQASFGASLVVSGIQARLARSARGGDNPAACAARARDLAEAARLTRDLAQRLDTVAALASRAGKRTVPATESEAG